MWNAENNREFFKKQLAISKDIIEEAIPRIVVVNNTFARDLMLGTRGEEKLFEFEFSDVLGTHKIVNNKALGEIPVFFTSMLTGQRALDNGSFERLGWHIKFVRDKKKDLPV
jgi:hypothetical protein